MPYVVKDRVKVTSTTTGTGTFTLGAAVTGFQGFSSLVPSPAWNITYSSYLQLKDVGAQETSPQGIFFKPDGLKMYVVGATGDDVNEYDLSSAWDISTATYLQVFSVSAQDTSPRDLFFKPDGLKMYVVGATNDSVYEYDLSSAWNVSTASYLQTKSVSAQDTTPTGVFFKDDGTKMYVVGGTGNDINEYDLSSAWDISTASYLRNFSVVSQTTLPQGVFFKSDGLKMYIIAANNIFEYSLGTAWNISTAAYSSLFETNLQGTGIFFKSDGLKFYITETSNADVREYDLATSINTYYCLTNGTDWEVGIGEVSYPGTSLIRSTVLESSNSNNKVDWSAGTKDVFCTFPADATEGTVPQGDTSQVGTDLVAWTNLKKELDRTVINGVPYNNNGLGGVYSTYSLINTTSSGTEFYIGGVLATNGDIHFIPVYATRGQKVSSSGVVSTYALVYTTGEGYTGGVLASNGDIHFVPQKAAVGQKISASGVVSTYSLVTTGTPGYMGGVLAPNGDIHFIPYSASVGQKVSAAGVVSTYSLVYTTGNAYFGGVLAPNGDIHFVPFSANRGQKISSAGVVSTYSLVSTSTVNGQYMGGVLAANGDIHFVPRDASRGQKISAAGVVSTYSLIYTTANTAFTGGVLAPNGDIHFVPFTAPVGQKVSASGVVSTYSLLSVPGGGVSQYLAGAVLSPSGDIYFVPGGAWPNSTMPGLKISTGTTRNIGYALSPFFNKF